MNSDKILIIRLSSIGDIIQCSGVPRNLKHALPQCQVHWLVRSDNLELVKFNPFIDRAISFNRQEGFMGWIKLAKLLIKEEYTHVYDAHNNIRSRILCFYLKPQFFIRRSKNRVKRFLLFWLKINTFPKPYLSTESYISPLATWGVKSDHLGGSLHIPPLTLSRVKNLLPSGVDWVALAPATAWPKKNWPVSYWVQFVKLILEKTSFNVLILGGPQDHFCKELCIDPKRTLSLQGQLSLLESAAASILSVTLVAADTGVLHLAEALGQNVVGILGPTPFGHPNRKDSRALQTTLWCQPCSKDGSGPCLNPTYQKCMKAIKPEDVMTSFNEVVGRP